MHTLDNDVKEEIESSISAVEDNKRIQGHICINDSKLFDASVDNGIYGFPGQRNTTINNLKKTAWRAIASLYNIGPEDLVFLYRTRGTAPGAQEFHGIFRVSAWKDIPLLLLHFKDKTYLPRRSGKTALQYLPFRFLFQALTRNPISIPNDLRNRTYQKNNNLEIIKALSETDPDKPKLWGFRHPAVMNIGAARKSSIVAISNSQVRFLLGLLSEGVERPKGRVHQDLNEYNPGALPNDCVLMDDVFLSEHFSGHVSMPAEYEAELYAYIIGALKNPKSSFHKRIVDDFQRINTDLPFDKIAENVILEAVITPHIQEEVDILLCDSEERNFLIMEVKNDWLTREDIEQAEKYVQLVNQRFPKSDAVSANVIGRQNTALADTERVKLVSYQIEKIRGKAAVTFGSNSAR